MRFWGILFISQKISSFEWLRKWRSWLPVPQSDGRIHLGRWFLLEGNRNAVSVMLLTLVFISLILIGTVRAFEMQQLLTETPAVQTILTTLLSGIILLVSIVVSINSIILSHDITSVQTQENRFESMLEFRQEIGKLSDSDKDPVDPSSFLMLMAETIPTRAKSLQEAKALDNAEDELVDEITDYVDSIQETTEKLEKGLTGESGADFGVLWRGLEFNYGQFVDRLDMLRYNSERELSTEFDDKLDEMISLFELFAVGKEYFKTLYYTQEIAELSRTLLFISLPAIIVNASTILAINANLLPEIWLFGLPPLLTSVAITLTISLAPYVILTAYMVRLATVAKKTATAGPFSINH